MNDPIPDIALKNGEVALQSWRPARHIFMRKLFFVGSVTTFAFGGIQIPSSIFMWFLTLLMFPLSMLLYVIMFDDIREWFERRNDIWTLTNQRLLYLNTSESMEPSEFLLSNIAKIRGWMWWTLRVTLTDGRGFRIDFLPDRKLVRATIISARDFAEEARNG